MTKLEKMWSPTIIAMRLKSAAQKSLLQLGMRRVCRGYFFFALLLQYASASAQNIDIIPHPRALSATLLRITVPASIEKSTFYVELMHAHDNQYRTLDLVKPGELSIHIDQFTEMPDGSRVLILPAVLVGAQSIETAAHPFRNPGEHSIRLRANASGNLDSVVLFERSIAFTEPSQADIDYFSRTDNAEYADLIGLTNIEVNQREQPTLIGLAILAHIIESTRQERDPTHGRSEWAEPLYELAFAVEDSSYAPYLAYYAACSYMWQRKHVFVKTQYGYTLPDERIAELEHYKRAKKALELAVDRGDPYIRPFATCFLAAMHSWAGDDSKARALLNTLKGEASQSKQIARLIAEADEYLDANRQSDDD